MRLVVRHEIILDYAPPAKSALGVLRLQPRLCDNQHVATWSVDLNHDCGLSRRVDCYGNACSAFHAEGPLERLAIVASGELATFDGAGVLRGGAEPFPLEVFLRETDATKPSAELAAFARETVASAQSLLDRPHLLMRALHQTLAPSDAQGGATRAFAARKGDARDMAHVMIAAARAVELPARIVTGYVWRAREADCDAHAWAEIFVEDVGWIGFDVGPCLCAHDAYAHLAVGLDFADVDPLRTAFYGGGTFKRISRLSLWDGTAERFAASDAAPAKESDAPTSLARQSQS